MRFMIIFVFLFLTVTSNATASVIITEILADPAPGVSGDANNDGNTSSTQDEFVELFNNSAIEVSLSGWTLADSLKPRHLFGEGATLLPGSYLVVFGGGEPNLDGINWQVASTGGLGLNNGGDTVSLLNELGETIDMMSYGSLGGNNQSLVRFPEPDGKDFMLHAEASGLSNKLFSPGRATNDQSGAATVPEAGTIFILGMGILVMKHLKLKTNSAKCKVKA